MKLWSAFYPDLLSDLPGAPLPLVDHWLRNVAIDFCERTKAYVEDLAAADSVALQMEYAPTLPENTELAEIRAIKYDGEQLDVKSRKALQAEFGDWESETGVPVYWTQAKGDTVLLVPAPEEAATGAIEIKAALKPGLAATGVEDWIFSKWRLQLCAGVKAAMMSQLNKPWTNVDIAVVSSGQYEAAVLKATSAVNDGYSSDYRPRFSGSFC